jgi:hypothetical protein
MVAALSVVVGLGSGLVGAQGTGSGGNGFRVSPVRSEYIIDKGKSETMSVTVENPTDAQVVAKAVVNDFVASDQENGEPRLILDENAPRPKNSFKDLVGNLADLTLAPRQSKDLKITIRVPLDANSGGYYGAVRFVPVTSTGAGNVGLTASVGTIVLVKVPGDLTEKLDLVQLSAAQKGKTKGFITGGDVNVITRLKNTGNIHVQPFGKVQVKNMFGKVIKEYELNSTDPRANVLPDSIRRFDDGIGKVGFKWLGRNTITANIGYSQGSGDLITASSRFWYLPLWFLIVLLLLVIAIVGGLFWVISRRRGSGSRRRR